jgi:hypothetical protein
MLGKLVRARRCVLQAHIAAATWTIAAAAPLSLLAVPPHPPLVFVSRTLGTPPQADGRTAAVERASRGSLRILSEDNVNSALVDATIQGPSAPTDVSDPDVSYDGQRVVFSGFVPEEAAWRIFEIAKDGAGGLRQLTHSDRKIDLNRYGAAAQYLGTYDDVDPCYLPDGRICFVSTRYPGIAPDGRLRTTNLYVVNIDGSELHRITSERFAADTPAVHPTTGRIVYSRWWRTAQALKDGTGDVAEPIPPGSPGYGGIDTSNGGMIAAEVLRGVDPGQFPGVNSWFLASIAPDGTGMSMHSGFRLDRQATQAYRPSFEDDGSVLALFIPQTPFLGAPGPNGLRRFRQGPTVPEALGGPQSFAIPGLPLPGEPPRGADGQAADGNAGEGNIKDPFFGGAQAYASAQSLGDGRILVAASLDGREFDLFLQDAKDFRVEPLLTLPGSAELDAVPLVSRPLPPVLTDGTDLPRLKDDVPRTVQEAREMGGTFKFSCENIFMNAPVDVAVATAPPIGKKLTIEFYMAPQRTGVVAADAPILIASQPVGQDGRVETELPAGVPLFELLRRPDDSIALGRDGQIFHVGGMNFGEAGQKGSCVGCHAGHSMMTVPEDASLFNLAPSALVTDNGPPMGAAEPIDAAVGADGVAFPAARNLVDRRRDAFVGEWIAFDSREKYEAELRWSVEVEAQEVVLYGSSTALPVDRLEPAKESLVHAFTLIPARGTGQLPAIEFRGDVLRDGVHVRFDAPLRFDRLTLSVKRNEIDFGADVFFALAELEVIGKVAGDGQPLVAYVRGDANSDVHVDLSDAITTLLFLFQGGPVGCAAAADANADGDLNITDVVFLLGGLFQGAAGFALPPPYPSCGLVPETRLLCDHEACQ